MNDFMLTDGVIIASSFIADLDPPFLDSFCILS
jgi:hypothetical protein